MSCNIEYTSEMVYMIKASFGLAHNCFQLNIYSNLGFKTSGLPVEITIVLKRIFVM